MQWHELREIADMINIMTAQYPIDYDINDFRFSFALWADCE